jgi:hypothetical protein
MSEGFQGTRVFQLEKVILQGGWERLFQRLPDFPTKVRREFQKSIGLIGQLE